MSSFSSILVPTDFSPCSDYGVAYAASLSRRLGASVHLFHIIETDYLDHGALYGQTALLNMAEVEESAVRSLEQRASTIRDQGLDVETHIHKGIPADMLLDMAKKLGCDLIVVGTHGHTGFNRFLFGSTCERLVRQAPVPVLAVKRPSKDSEFNDADFKVDRILCTTDLSDLSKNALPYAQDLCAQLDASLLLLHVVDTRYESMPHLAAVDQASTREAHKHAELALKEIASNLGELSVETRVLDGSPHDRIEAVILENDIDLLIMTTHGRTGVLHALLGSTAEKVVRIASCPVLTIRPE